MSSTNCFISSSCNDNNNDNDDNDSDNDSDLGGVNSRSAGHEVDTVVNVPQQMLRTVISRQETCHHDLLALLLLYGALLVQPDHVVVHGGALEVPKDELLREVARVVQLSEGSSGIIPVPIWAPLSARVT